MDKRYRIGDIAKECSVTIRTVRYYEELGLLKQNRRTRGNQRYYSENDILYIKRILELKDLGFSLEEIKKIVSLKKADETGEKRRNELLRQYRAKLSESLERKQKIEDHIDELSWRIKQLEGAADTFTECPGPLCKDCIYSGKCIFGPSNKLD